MLAREVDCRNAAAFKGGKVEVVDAILLASTDPRAGNLDDQSLIVRVDVAETLIPSPEQSRSGQVDHGRFRQSSPVPSPVAARRRQASTDSRVPLVSMRLNAGAGAMPTIAHMPSR